MARNLRIEYPGALYHVMARGNDSSVIFKTNADRLHLLELLTEALDRYEVKLYAYVFMKTHYHLILQTEHPNLHEFMHYLNTAYTVWTNLRNSRRGHLFEGRYKAIVMETDGYLLSATGYIHLNPVRTLIWNKKTVKERMERVANYPWSSYRAYTHHIDKNSTPPISCDQVWSTLHARTERHGYKQYHKYIKGWLQKEDEARTKPKNKHKKSIFNPFAETKLGCYLGGDDFRDMILQYLGKDRNLSTEIVGHKKWNKSIPISKLFEQIKIVLEVSQDLLFTSKHNNISRDMAMYLCRESCQKTLREIGDMFKVKPPAVSLACKRIKTRKQADKQFDKQIAKMKNSLIKTLKT